MKTKLFAILALAMCISLTAFATTPEQLSYQAVIKDASNNLVVSHAIGLKISILQTTSSGTVVYSETHTTTSNTNGLVSVAIGTGTVVSGTFASIDWSAGTYFIKSEIDPAGGSTYTVSGTSQLQSVPYALHAKTVDGLTTALNLKVDKVSGKGLSTNDYTTAEQTKLAGITSTQWTTSGSNVYYNTGNVGIGTTTPTAKLDVSGEVNFSENLTISKNIKWANSGYGIQLSFATVGPKDALVSRNASGSQWVDVGSDAAWSGVTLAANGGNVGIGTTSPLSKISAVNNNFDATTNPGYKFYGHQSSSSATVPLFHIQTAWENTVTANVFKVNTYQNEAGFNILANGNVGIGTTSPQAKLQVDGRVIINNAAAPGFYGQSAGTNKVYLGYDGAGTGLELYNFTSGRSLMVRDNGDLTYLGNVGIGTTTPGSKLHVESSVSNSYAAVIRNYNNTSSGYGLQVVAGSTTASYGAYLIDFFDATGATRLGSITQSGSNTVAYNTSSDYRLKDNIVNTHFGINDLMKIQVRDYVYKADASKTQVTGFIAQELYEIFPNAVTKPAKAEEMWSVDYGKITPLLVKAIQEQQKQIEALTKLVEKLEKK